MQGTDAIGRDSLPAPEARRELRKASGFRAHELAAQIGVSPSSVYAWEAGTAEPTGLQRAAYSSALRTFAARHGEQLGVTWPADS